MSALQHAIAEAVALAGGDLCAAGHDWRVAGGRPCHCTTEIGEWRGMTVFECARCGEFDYGKPGGPGAAECAECRHSPLNQFTSEPKP